MAPLETAQKEVHPQAMQITRKRGPFYFAALVLLFFLPLLLFGLVAEFALWKSGESWPLTRVIAEQARRGDAIFMRGILDQGFQRYKLLNIENRQPRIVALGSSRVMEFRKEMFPGVEFYNAGGIIQGLDDLTAFVNRLTPETTPEVLIVGVDIWWLSANHKPGADLKTAANYDAATDWQAHLKSIRRFKSSKTYKPAFRSLKAQNGHIGIQARNSATGFRSDGSMQYQFPLPQTAEEWKFVDREKPPIPERIRTGEAPFLPNHGMSSERAEQLNKCLEELARKNVLVLGFFPPFSTEAASLMESHPGQATLWKKARQHVPKLFAANGLTFIDASTTGTLGLDDRYLIDGIHAAETFHLHLLQRFLQTPEFSQALPELSTYLTRVLQSVKTNPWHPDFTAAREQD